MIRFPFLLSCILYITAVSAQPFAISGKIADTKDNSPLTGVNISLINVKDSSLLLGTSTDIDGKFLLENIEKGDYKLNISYISYKTNEQFLKVNENISLNTILLAEDSKLLKEVVIEEKQIRVQQLGDTSQFNANAFKTNRASSWVLVTRSKRRLKVE